MGKSAMTALLEVNNLTYSYPGTNMPALDGLSFHIPAGKKTVLLGHNGCGKSTFFLQAIGILRPDEGNLSWQGVPFSYKRKGLLSLRQKIGIVFQDPEQQLILPTPREDISYGLRNAKVPENEISERTSRILAQMGLYDIADIPLQQLSLGQKKRVALAGVLVLNPELLLLDEPTVYLDQLSLAKMLAELQRIHLQGTTILMATHDMNIAYEWADWVIVLNSGKCVMEGTPLDVFSRSEEIRKIGLELPYLFQIWQSIAKFFQRGVEPPRSIAALSNLLETIHH
jgi:cobalt/nickel transport system ATP-binding protein